MSLIQLIGKHLAALSVELLAICKDFYRNSIVDLILKEEEEQNKKMNGKKTQIEQKSDDTDCANSEDESNREEIENYLSECSHKAKETEFCKDFFDCENLEEKLVLKIAVTSLKKKRRKKKDKGIVPADIPLNSHSLQNEIVKKQDLKEEKEVGSNKIDPAKEESTHSSANEKSTNNQEEDIKENLEPTNEETIITKFDAQQVSKEEKTNKNDKSKMKKKKKKDRTKKMKYQLPNWM